MKHVALSFDTFHYFSRSLKWQMFHTNNWLSWLCFLCVCVWCPHCWRDSTWVSTQSRNNITEKKLSNYGRREQGINRFLFSELQMIMDLFTSPDTLNNRRKPGMFSFLLWMYLHKNNNLTSSLNFNLKYGDHLESICYFRNPFVVINVCRNTFTR